MSRSIVKSKINFFSDNVKVRLTERAILQSFITSMFKKEKVPFLSVNFIFCSDQRLLAINKQYLAHDFLTDIITFNLAGKEKTVEGEVYISVDRVQENAKNLNFTFKIELHRVIFHGILHLCGYNDKTQAQAQKMRSLEDKYLNSYFSR